MSEATLRLAKRIRKNVLNMIYHSKSSHIGSSFSVADLMAVLYGQILNVGPENLSDKNRDRFILSKGHAAAVLYATLAEKGFFPVEELKKYNQDGSVFSGHAIHKVPGVEVSSGSLGHGLSIGCGMALAAKIDNLTYKTFVIISDGECDEGSIWEAALFAGAHKLHNLVTIIDYNKIQSFGRVSEVLNLEPLVDKWQSFGWCVVEVDGHDHNQIERAFKENLNIHAKPLAIIAHTVKGRGVSFMEDKLLWHYKSPTSEQYLQASQELEIV